jgi:Na+/phosphate symporter
MCEKCEKLLMDYAELEKEMTNLRKETIEMEQKIAMLYEELAQFKGQIQRENLGSQQSQNPMMENSV